MVVTPPFEARLFGTAQPEILAAPPTPLPPPKKNRTLVGNIITLTSAFL